MTTTDPTTERAVRTVARRVLAKTIAKALDFENPAISWEDHPEIGEYDWHQVIADVHRLAERGDVQDEHYQSAHRHLAGRARETEEGPQ